MDSIKGWLFFGLPSVATETSTMQSIIIISAILACSTAAPAYLLAEQPDAYHVPLTSSKSTYTQSSQVIDHGSTHVLHPVATYHSIPVAHAKTTITKADQLVNHGSTYIHPVHSISVMPVHEVYHVPKTTITKSNQVVNHGGTTLVHAPLVSVAHAPVVSVAHAPVVYHSSPLVTLKTGDSAVSHHSSTVHETVPVVKSVPLITYHH